MVPLPLPHGSRRGQSNYGVFIEVRSAANKVVLMGVRKDVETAAEKVREISHEFRMVEERWPLLPYQVGPSVERVTLGGE